MHLTPAPKVNSFDFPRVAMCPETKLMENIEIPCKTKVFPKGADIKRSVIKQTVQKNHTTQVFNELKNFNNLSQD